MSKDRQSQSKIVPLIYGGIAGALLIVIAALALVLVPPSPPQVAEFAPQAQEQIEEAPNKQSSRFGAGEGACFVGQECESAVVKDGSSKAPRRVVEKTRVRRCIGTPPRQTEDPQSPPCVNYWAGENGGASSHGVTGNEIRIGVPYWSDSGTEGDTNKFIDAVFDHFNRRYEFYGRKLRRVDLDEVSNGGPAKQRAIAAAANEQKVFSSTGFSELGRQAHMEPFRRELARYRIISLGGDVESVSSETLEELRPYAWTFYSPLGSLGQALGQFACTSLAGRSARFAGPEFQLTARQFAALYVRDEFPAPPMQTLQESLRRCGTEMDIFSIQAGGASAGLQPTDQYSTVSAQLKADGYTTVFWLDDSVTGTRFMVGASQAQYRPEFIMGGGAEHNNEAAWAVSGVPEQRLHMFGIAPWNKTLAGEDEPTYWAVRESDSRITPGQAAGPLQSLNRFYRQLLLISSGIQLAGPQLTPTSFSRGLESAHFPNPGAGAAPYYQSAVGFEQRDYSMADDVAVVSWSETAPAHYYKQVGGFCYVERGRRFRINSFIDLESKLFPPNDEGCR